MKNGLLKFLELAKSRSDIGAIEATIAENNLASRRSVESVGFQLIGAADRGCNCGGEQVSAVQYEIVLKPSLL